MSLKDKILYPKDIMPNYNIALFTLEDVKQTIKELKEDKELNFLLKDLPILKERIMIIINQKVGKFD